MALSVVLPGSNARRDKLRLRGCERSAQDIGDKGEGHSDLDASLAEFRDCAAPPNTCYCGGGAGATPGICLASDFLLASPP